LLLYRIIAFICGLLITGSTLFSALETFVVPRSTPDTLTNFVFITMRKIFRLWLVGTKSYHKVDRVMAFYAPLSLVMLVPIWYFLVFVGYTCMYWGIGVDSWFLAMRESGSSLLTLGFQSLDGLAPTLMTFSEAVLGLMLVGLLVSYLPTMYAAFARRETMVTLLDVRAGIPPSAVEMIKRYQRIHGLDALSEQWQAWEAWFADLEESHTSLPALVFFRSPQGQRSWLTAAGAVLDAASLTLSMVQIPQDAKASLCIRAGYLCLRRIADHFQVEYDPNPTWENPIHISREEFEKACDDLQMNGVALNQDRDKGWRDFAGWRVNYDTVLVALADITAAPPSPWTGERSYK
jgi:hypothetical protein